MNRLQAETNILQLNSDFENYNLESYEYKGSFKYYVTQKLAIFDPPSPLVTIGDKSLPPSPLRHVTISVKKILYNLLQPISSLIL